MQLTCKTSSTCMTLICTDFGKKKMCVISGVSIVIRSVCIFLEILAFALQRSREKQFVVL